MVPGTGLEPARYDVKTSIFRHISTDMTCTRTESTHKQAKEFLSPNFFNLADNRNIEILTTSSKRDYPRNQRKFMTVIYTDKTEWKDKNSVDMERGRKANYYDENGQIIEIVNIICPWYASETFKNNQGAIEAKTISMTQIKDDLVVPNNRLELI